MIYALCAAGTKRAMDQYRPAGQRLETADVMHREQPVLPNPELHPIILLRHTREARLWEEEGRCSGVHVSAQTARLAFSQRASESCGGPSSWMTMALILLSTA